MSIHQNAPGPNNHLEALLSRVWSPDSETSTQTIRTSPKRLRAKIDVEGKPSLIENIYGIGYVLEI